MLNKPLSIPSYTPYCKYFIKFPSRKQKNRTGNAEGEEKAILPSPVYANILSPLQKLQKTTSALNTSSFLLTNHWINYSMLKSFGNRGVPDLNGRNTLYHLPESKTNHPQKKETGLERGMRGKNPAPLVLICQNSI
jgi:hypothetical protein